MRRATGANAKMWLGYEPDYLGAVTKWYQMPFLTSGLSRSQAKAASEMMTGRRDPSRPISGNIEVAGDVVVPLDSRALWYWLNLGLDPEVAVANATEWDHVFKIGMFNKPCSIVIGFTDLDTPKYLRYTGVEVNSMGFTFGGEGERQVSLGMIGANRVIDDVAPTPDVDLTAYDPMDMKHEDPLEACGVTAECMESFTCNVEYALEGLRCIGGKGAIGSLAGGKLNITGELSGVFQSTERLQKAIDNTECSIIQTVTRDAANVFQIALEETELSEQDPAVDTPSGLSLISPYSAYFQDGTNGSALQITLTNNVQDPLLV